MSEITIVLDNDDAGYVAVALREHAAQWRRFADSQTNISGIVTTACERLEKIATRIEKEIDHA